MNILAFDLGTTTGWASYTPGIVTSGTLKLASGRYEGGGMRYLRFRRHVKDLIDTVAPDVVVFEEVRRHLGTDAAHVYGGLMSQLTAYCEEIGRPYQGVPVGTIKKHATGKGNASKEQMLDAARARGWEPKDDNEADALWLLDWMRRQG